MNTVRCKLITIVIEDELETRILEDLRRLGVRGYTITKARGAGRHSVRGSEWEGENIIIEILAGEQTAQSVLDFLAQNYFEHFGVTAFLVDAEVIRKDKYI